MWTLVTGASGFVGSHVVRELVSQGRPVLALQRKYTPIDGVPDEDTQTFHRIIGDLSDEIKIEVPVSNLIHCAAAVVLPGSTAYNFAIGNVITAGGAIEVIEKYNVKNIIVLSSISVYGNSWGRDLEETADQINVESYGLSKLLVERMFEDISEGREVLIIRLPGVIGKNCNPVWLSKAVETLQENRNLTITNPDSLFNQFVHVRDVVDFIGSVLLALPKGYQAVNFAPSAEMTLSEVILFLKDGLKSHSTILENNTNRKPGVVRSCIRDDFPNHTIRHPKEMLDELVNSIFN